MAAITQNMSLNLKIDSKGCTFLLRALIWHLKAYAFVADRLYKLLGRERMHVNVTVGEVQKETGQECSSRKVWGVDKFGASVYEDEIKLIEVPFQKVSVNPGDVIVLMTDCVLSGQAVENIERSVQPRFPDNKIMVLEDRLKLAVMAKGEEAS